MRPESVAIYRIGRADAGGGMYMDTGTGELVKLIIKGVAVSLYRISGRHDINVLLSHV